MIQKLTHVLLTSALVVVVAAALGGSLRPPTHVYAQVSCNINDMVSSFDQAVQTNTLEGWITSYRQSACSSVVKQMAEDLYSTYIAPVIIGALFGSAGTSIQTGQQGDIPTPGDYDGDGTDEVSVWRPSTGEWFISMDNASWGGGAMTTLTIGAAGDTPVPADYNGDGKTDVATWRPSDGIWTINLGNQSILSIQTGQQGDIPVPADYDGDGSAEVAVWRPSNGTWYVSINNTNWGTELPIELQLGQSGDIPVPANYADSDYRGKRMDDFAVWRPSDGTWHVIYVEIYLMFQGADPVLSQIKLDKFELTAQSGASEDLPVPGDYDGDGYAEFGVWRASAGQWYISLDNTNWGAGPTSILNGGIVGDIPRVGDFNGDGKLDNATWRPSDGTWRLP